MKIADIVIGERQRQDLGDIDGLADSLKAYEQIQAIGVDENNKLIWGRRRLAAATKLGWEKIRVVKRKGLSALDGQMIEWEEDIRQKPRNWKELCVATADLYKMIKTAKTIEAGENWTYAQMAEWTGFGVFKTHYMIAVAEELKKDPEGEISKCSGIKEALHIFAERRRHEAVAEQERRRQGVANTEFENVVVGDEDDNTQDINTWENNEITRASSSTVERNEIRIWAYNCSVNKLISGMGEVACVLMNRYDEVEEIIKSMQFVQAHGTLVSFFDPIRYLDMIGEVNLLVPASFPFIWITPNEVRTTKPLGLDYKCGLVAYKGAPPETTPASSFIIAPTQDDKMLPMAVVSHLLNALTLDGQLVLCLGAVSPVDVAACGRVPVIIEEYEDKFKLKVEQLKAYYLSVIPGAVFI